MNTGNNLLYMVLGAQLALLLVSNALAEWNLRGLVVERRLPGEAYAGRPAGGAFVLHNRRRRGGAFAVHAEDLEAPGTEARFAFVAAGGWAEAPAWWSFPRRGPAPLGRIRVWSAWPFGLFRRSRDLEVKGSFLVFPAPLPGVPALPAGSAGGGRESPRQPGRTGDFRGLRPYVQGDSLRDLHWPTTARTGFPMVVERAAETADEVVIEVHEADGAAWELALSRACGQVLWHAGLGHAMGLRLGGQVLAPRTGEAWKRQLLARLALAPERGGAGGSTPRDPRVREQR